MQISNPTVLQTLFWEIRNRFFYILLSFVFSFLISYQKAKPLLYLFVLSYGSKTATEDGSNTLINDVVKAGKDSCKASEIKDFSVFLRDSPLFSSFCPLSHPVNETQLEQTKNLYDVAFENDLMQIKDLQSCFPQSVALQIEDLLSPIHFIFTDVEEAFSNIVLVCFIFSFISVIPILLYQSFCFFSSSLYGYESKKCISRLFIIAFFWCFFVYTVQNFLIPKLAEFLLFFQVSTPIFSLSAETKISSYCSWVSNIWLVTNLLFFLLVWFFFANLSITSYSPPWSTLPQSKELQEKTKDVAKEVSFSHVNKAKEVVETKTMKEYQRTKPETFFSLPSFLFVQYNNKENIIKKSPNVKRKINLVISILISAFIAPPETIQLILTLFFFFSFEIAIYFFMVIKHLVIKKRTIQ